MKNLVSLEDIKADEISSIIDLGLGMKKNPGKYATSMKDKTLAMVFQKPSLRTRVSFEAGMTKMGGHAIYLGVNDIQLGRGESIEDTARTLTGYVDVIMARLFEHSDMEKLASAAEVPVINGLTNANHPCQILADLMTIKEVKGGLEGLKLAFLGDGKDNVLVSFINACPKVGMELSVGCPKELSPSVKGEYTLTQDAEEAVENADVVYTDTWMSMHIPEEEKSKRVEMFKPYQVNEELMSKAKKDAVFMHCLPAYRGYEVSEGVIDGNQSVVFQEAENRMWSQNAVILKLLSK